MDLKKSPLWHPHRAKPTLRFLKRFQDKLISPVLDIAEPNPMSEYIGRELNLEIHNTVGDLDYEMITSLETEKYKTVFCFEVIEHLMNPRMFFDNLYNTTVQDVNIFLSYPSRPKMFWNNVEHFHEYDSRRFNYLLKKTGFQIIEPKGLYFFQTKYLHTGIRPWIRLLMPSTRIYYIQKV